MSIKNIRNEFAHKWLLDEIKYKNKFLTKTGFGFFWKDLIVAWRGLELAYNKKIPTIKALTNKYKKNLR